MGGLDKIPEPPTKHMGGTCTVALIRKALDPLDRETFDGWLWAKDKLGRWTRSAEWIAESLRQEPYDIMVAARTITRHRGSGCQCPR